MSTEKPTTESQTQPPAEIIDVPATIDATPTGILATIEIQDYSQFLTSYSVSGQLVTEFTAEGIKTIALQYGISTGDVEIQETRNGSGAIFRCTATNTHTGQTASVNVYQSFTTATGKEDRFWVEKGTTRAIRNAQKALLPVGLLKIALQKAIQQGNAQQSDLIQAQRETTKVWQSIEADFFDIGVSKREVFDAAQEWLGDAEMWDAETWRRFAVALKASADALPEWEQGLAEDLSSL